jgi:TPR repeat protein
MRFESLICAKEHPMPRRLSAALGLTLMVAGCSATDPAMKRGIADVDQRPASARVALRPFAEQGNETAIAQICIAYGRSMDYRVGNPERAQAFAWCKHAATAGNTEAQYHLGDFYKSGIGTAEDRTAALQWYRQAASYGHQEAENEARGLEGKGRVCRNFITNCKMF